MSDWKEIKFEVFDGKVTKSGESGVRRAFAPLRLYLDKHYVKSAEKNSYAIQPYIEEFRYAKEKNPTTPDKWSGFLFIDIDSKKVDDKKIATIGDVERAKSVICSNKALLNCLAWCSKSAGQHGLHIALKFCQKSLSFEDYRKYSAYALRLIKNILGGAGEVFEFDTHNCDHSQLFYSGYDPDIFINNNINNAVGIQELDVCAKLPPIDGEQKNNTRKIVKTDEEIVSIAGQYVDNNIIKKCKVDRNLVINEMRGNDVRWRISRIADEVFGDRAKEWCDKYFFYENNKSIYSRTSNFGINRSVLNWLVREGYLLKAIITKNIESKQNPGRQTRKNYHEIEMEGDEYLSEYVDEIKEYIDNENVLSIQAPTGAGKTTMLSGMIAGKKSAKGLVDVFPNSIILVPHNSTLHLYEGLNVVSSRNDNELKNGRPNVMVWDQFVKHSGEVMSMRLSVVFIDESHNLFMNRTYRPAASEGIALLRKLQEKGVKLVFISATPAGEVVMFNAFELSLTKKDDRNVKFGIYYVRDTFSNMKRDWQMYAAEGYDRVCIFSDKDTRKGYANCFDAGYDAAIYHSEWPENVDELKRTERLTHGINFLTCIAFDALNFRNEGEKILIDIRLTERDTTYNDIIQIVGRFRNNKDIDVRLYVDRKWESQQELQDIFDKAKAIIDSESEEVITEYWKTMNDPVTQESFVSVQGYKDKFTIELIAGMLKNAGYVVKPYKETNIADKADNKNPVKVKANNAFKKMRIEDSSVSTLIEKCNEEEAKFIRAWCRKMNELCGKYGGRVWEMLDEYIKKEKGSTRELVDNIIAKLENALWVHSMDDEEWEAIKSKRTLLLSVPGLSQDFRNGLIRKFAENDKLRKKYKDEDFSVYFDDMITELEDKVINKSKTSAKGGLASKRNHCKQLMYDGILYDSRKELQIACNIKDKMYYKLKEKGLIVEISKIGV